MKARERMGLSTRPTIWRTTSMWPSRRSSSKSKTKASQALRSARSLCWGNWIIKMSSCKDFLDVGSKMYVWRISNCTSFSSMWRKTWNITSRAWEKILWSPKKWKNSCTNSSQESRIATWKGSSIETSNPPTFSSTKMVIGFLFR